MSQDFEVEEGREVVRRTIVGGRPRAREKRRIRVPIGLEKVLCRAAGDWRFRDALLTDRKGALDAAGYELLVTEQAVLDSVPKAVLASMIDRIDVKQHGRGRFMRGVMAAAFAATTTLAVQACDSEATPAGIQPDDILAGRTDVVDIQNDADPSRGVSPDVPDVLVMPEINADEGMRPDIVHLDSYPPVDVGILPDVVDVVNPVDIAGIQPDEIEPPDAMPAGILPDVVDAPDVMLDGGVRPDVVDLDGPASLGIQPDVD